jgi:hypothetical protein
MIRWRGGARGGDIAAPPPHLRDGTRRHTEVSTGVRGGDTVALAATNTTATRRGTGRRHCRPRSSGHTQKCWGARGGDNAAPPPPSSPPRHRQKSAGREVGGWTAAPATTTPNIYPVNCPLQRATEPEALRRPQPAVGGQLCHMGSPPPPPSPPSPPHLPSAIVTTHRRD